MPPPPPLALLFDLDGTLADSLDLILGAVRHTFRTHLGTVPPDQAWIAGLGTPLASQLRSLVSDKSMIEPMVATYREWQTEHHDALLREFEGVRETLALLHARGHAMALVTSKGDDAAHRALRILGLAPYIAEVVGLESTNIHKPNPEPVLHALARLDRSPNEAIFVGDSPHDITAGNAAGVYTVAALWGPFSRPVLEAARPRQLIAHIRDLPPLINALGVPQPHFQTHPPPPPPPHPPPGPPPLTSK